MPWMAGWCVVLVLTTVLVWQYARIYDPTYGWTKLIRFGASFAPGSLPQLKKTTHYVDPDPGNRYGYDGQFYAQIALDPSLRTPDFATALDVPSYRARRIALPALSYLLCVGKRPWILQAYSLSNLVFWFVLALILLRLLGRPNAQSLLCLAAALLGFGIIVSMDRAVSDLPATTLIFGALLTNLSVGTALLSSAVLTRETSVLAALATVEWRRFSWRTLRSDVLRLAVALLPFALWLGYLKFRFTGPTAVGGGNFTWPFIGFGRQVIQTIRQVQEEPTFQQAWNHMTWRHFAWRHLLDDSYIFHLVYDNFVFHELLIQAALLAQGIYLLLRPNLNSIVWRIGISYLILACFLGPAVWVGGQGSSRVLLPMSIAFCILLAAERRPAIFWLFFVVTALAIPYGFFELTTLYHS